MLDIYWILAFLLLGCLVGFAAGLLGVGGGGIMVPVLSNMFMAQNIAAENAVHLALGTSMAAIIGTSFSSLNAHRIKQNVDWTIIRYMSVGVLFGAFSATFFAIRINALYLALFFSAFMLFVAIRMFKNVKPKPTQEPQGNSKLVLAGSGIGAVSALVSIGGGALTVPYLVWRNLDMRKAIGTSAALGLPIAITGTVGFVINAWSVKTELAFTFGYVYLPAVCIITFASAVFAPLGVKAAHALPVAMLKKVFGILLVMLSAKMLISVL